MNKKFIPFVLILFFGFTTLLSAQNQKLKAFSDSLRAAEVQKQDRIKRFADSLNLEMRFELPDGKIIELVDIDNDQPLYYTTLNDSGAQLINADQVHPGGGLGLSLTGAGQRLGIWDGGGVRTTHQEFTTTNGSRVTQLDVPQGLSGHATHVAGTMIATGAETDQRARGMAYQANLEAYDWTEDLLEMTDAAAGGLQASQHSYGFITGWIFGTFSGNIGWHWFGDTSISQLDDYRFGYYDNRCRSWDLLANAAPEYLIFKSAGNNRGGGPTIGEQHYIRVDGTWVLSNTERNLNGGSLGYDCVIDAGNAKNVVTVGAVNASGVMSNFSSWGPTDDGRIKPDIVANGVSVYSASADNDSSYGISSGTSMSGPMVSGSMGLINQMYSNTYPGQRMLAATAKALIIHTANDEIGGSPGPDYRFGWGLLDVAKAVSVIGENAANNGVHMREMELQEGEEINIPIAATGNSALRVTIVWNDPAGTASTPALDNRTPKLVNDLDLRLIRGDNDSLAPYTLDPDRPVLLASTGDNFRDNVEMIHVAAPLPNEKFTISIKHKGSLQDGRQPFSIIITGNISKPVVANVNAISEQATLYVLGSTIVEENLKVQNLVIPANQKLRIVPGKVFTLTENWELDGELIFESNSTSYAVGALTKNFSGNGALTLQQFVGDSGVYLFGGPIEKVIATQGNLGGAGSGDAVFWDAENGEWTEVGANQTFEPFKGYAFSVGPQGFVNADTILSISGTPLLAHVPQLQYGELNSQMTSFSDPLTRSGWNLLANPFPAPLDFSSLDFSSMQNVEQAFYVEKHLQSGRKKYAAYSAAGSPNDHLSYIAPMQGFWVRAIANDPVFSEVGIQNTVLTPTPKAFKTETIREYIELQVLQNQEQLDHLTLALSLGVNDGFDNGLDARKLLTNNAGAEFFSIGDGDYLAINAIDYGPHAVGDKIIPLGLLLLDNTSNYEIAVNDAFLIEKYDVLLEDQLLSNFHDLRQGPYQFTGVEEQEFRFRLHLSNKTLLSDENFKSIKAWYANGQLFLRSLAYSGPVEWIVYDLNGKAVVNSPSKTIIAPMQERQISTAQLSAGTYVLHVKMEAGTHQYKVVIEQ